MHPCIMIPPRDLGPYLYACALLNLDLATIRKLLNKLKLTHANTCTLFYLIKKLQANYKLLRITLSLTIYCWSMHVPSMLEAYKSIGVPSSLL